MSTDTDGFDAERVRRYVNNNPSATPMDALAQLGLSPAYREHVAAIVNGEEPPATVPTSDSSSGGDVQETTEQLAIGEIREHYRRARPVYEALADVCGSETLAIADHVGWYTKRENDDPATADEWPKAGRCLTFSRDFDQFIERIERVAYATTAYNDPDYLSRWHPCRYDPDHETTE